MFVFNYEERELEDVSLPGAEKAKMRWLIGRKAGATTYAMRYFELHPGGIIPLHTHPEEHEIFILSGSAKVLGTAPKDNAKTDDVVFIPSMEPHGYDNKNGTEIFRFICVIPLIKRD